MRAVLVALMLLRTACLAALVAVAFGGSDVRAASLEDVDVIPFITTDNARGRSGYRDFLAAAKPRAFVIAASGAWAWQRGEGALEKALAACRRSTKATCIPYAVDDAVVWTPAPAGEPAADEGADWGVPPQTEFRAKDVHAPTPMTVPGARVITTAQLGELLSGGTKPLLLDVLGGSGHQSLPGAVWLKGAGLGGDTSPHFASLMERLTGGDRQKPIVAFCLSPYCWLSYNAAMRIARLGYGNVYWYRGGLFAWRAAARPVAPAVLHESFQ